MNSLPIIPYFQTTRIRVKAMVELASVKPGEKVADLGTGDGRIAIAFAQAGAIVTGFEINEKLANLAEKNIRKEQLSNKIKILQRDFWTENLSEFDVIAIYPMPDIMEALQTKLQKELKADSRTLTNYYQFPNWKEKMKKENVYLYRKGS